MLSGAMHRTVEATTGWPDADSYFGNYFLTNYENPSVSVSCRLLADLDGWMSPVALLQTWTLSGHSPSRKRVWKAVEGCAQRFSNGYQDVDLNMRALSVRFKDRCIDSDLYHCIGQTGMNASRMVRSLYCKIYSRRDYRMLGRQTPLREQVVLQFLERLHQPQVREDARRLILQLFSDQFSRCSLYLKYLLRICGSMSLNKLVSGGVQ